MSAMRFLLAGIVLYIFCLAKNEKHPDYNSFLKIMFRGILMLVGGTVSVAWAEQYLAKQYNCYHCYFCSILVHIARQETLVLLFF
jgi:hypothetical protein